MNSMTYNEQLRLDELIAKARKHRNSKGNKWALYNTMKQEIELLGLTQSDYTKAIVKLTEALNI